MAAPTGTSFSSRGIGTTNIDLVDANNLAILGSCTSTPDTTANVYQHGCLIIRTDSGTGSNAVYQNTGSSASPSWTLLPSSVGALLSASATGGVGYSTGAGGAVTQATSKSTTVTLNTVCGVITTNDSAVATTAVGFTLANSNLAATDTVVINLASGGTTNSYNVNVDAVAAGSCHVMIQNMSGVSKSETLVLNYAIIKAVNA